MRRSAIAAAQAQRRPGSGASPFVGVVVSVVLAFGVLVPCAHPAGASPAWSIAPSPSARGPQNGSLSAVACATTSSCFAVGTTGAVKVENSLLVHHWNGSRWSAMPVPTPPAATLTVTLSGVACPSAVRCFAVGKYQTNSAFRAFIERWNGAHWSIVAAPSPSGSRLNAASCPSTTRCFAVGSAGSGPFAEHWNGTHWSIVSAPGPSHASLNGVSCASAASCFAVGSGSKTLIERWDGAHWSKVSSPNPAGGNNARLAAVSCPSGTTCIAVGAYGSGSTIKVLVERWKGAGWSIVGAPSPAGATLNGVSCATTASCFAVGTAKKPPLTERWNGNGWAAVTAPGLKGSALNGVECVRASSCFAVGFAGFQLLDNAVQHANRTQVERWDGKRWSLVGGVDGGTQAGLARLSCSSAVHCVAVGNRLDAAGAARAIGQQWNGASWSTVPVPSPAGAIESVLRDVDCWSAASCVAVGSYRTSSAEQTLVERWNGTKWSIVASPNPSGDRSTRLDALSCPSAARCVAVGRSSRTYADSLTGASKALVLTWSGASWSIVTTPDPSGEYGRRLSAVSCASASSCVAVGFDETDPHLGGQGNMLIESWDGMTWSVVVSASAPLGSIVGGALSGVSCSAASSCVAVGWDADGPLAERWDGATWSQLTDPEPVGADPADLWGITCSSASSCVAVGRHWSPSTGSRVLVESWNGASWSIAGTPDPPTAYDSLLTGVSCPQATTCFAAGSFVDRAGSHTLIERYS